jgi:hypothetical protein
MTTVLKLEKLEMFSETRKGQQALDKDTFTGRNSASRRRLISY